MKIGKLLSEFKLLQRSVPSAVTALFAVSVVAMNLLANKSIDTGTTWLALDCGIIFSWAVFLIMDTVTKRYGPPSEVKDNTTYWFNKEEKTRLELKAPDDDGSSARFSIRISASYED